MKLIINNFLNKGHSRSIKAKKNIVASFFIKGISIIISLLIVPITINYIDASLYGIWLTLSSIIAWLGYFDLGFTHGFRNRFAEALAKKNYSLAKSYVSTTYISIGIIFTLVFFVTYYANHFLIWSSILNINEKYNSDVSNAFIITIGFFCLQMILKVIGTLLLADQKTALSNSINTIGQIINLLIIIIVSRSGDGNLTKLSLILGASPTFIMALFSVILFNREYRIYRPSFSSIELKLVRDIIGLGGKFFIIQISWLVIYQSTNIVITRILGPESVTSYNIQYKYFYTANMVLSIILAPMWSAFTEAYVKKDYNWMASAYNVMNKIWIGSILVEIILLFMSPWIFKLWIGNSIQLEFHTSILMTIYLTIVSRATIYITLISGIGKVVIQTIVNVGLAIIAIPLFIYFTKKFGLNGTIMATCLIPLIQTLIFHIQFIKILHKKDTRLWSK